MSQVVFVREQNLAEVSFYRCEDGEWRTDVESSTTGNHTSEETHKTLREAMTAMMEKLNRNTGCISVEVAPR